MDANYVDPAVAASHTERRMAIDDVRVRGQLDDPFADRVELIDG